MLGSISGFAARPDRRTGLWGCLFRPGLQTSEEAERLRAYETCVYGDGFCLIELENGECVYGHTFKLDGDEDILSDSPGTKAAKI
jgi:hypothetical protein